MDVKKIKMRYITNEKGEKTEIVLSVKDVEDILEDLSDLAAASERRDEETISHEELIKELRSDGLL